MKNLFLALVVLFLMHATALAQPAQRAMTLDDLARLRDVRDPQLSPDGKWIAYVVSTIDSKEDKNITHIWLASYDGTSNRQITFGQESESAPRWSPDGKFLAFTSTRAGAAKGSQIYLLDSSGGEALQLTEIKGRLQSYEWSPDAKQLALVIGDADPEAEANAKIVEGGGKPKAPKPIVLDRYKFKQDGQGYLVSGRNSFIYLFEIASKKLARLTKGIRDEASPVWSPDGAQIAFLSNRQPEADRDPAPQIYVAEAKAGGNEKAITSLAINVGRGRVEWSPDGKWLTFLESDEKKWGAYNIDHLAMIAADGSGLPTRVKSVETIDRGIAAPRFAADGKAIEFLVVDDQSVYPARVLIEDGKVEKLLAAPVVVSNWQTQRNATIALSGGNQKFTEIYASENGTLRQITHQNDGLLGELKLGATESVRFTSKDGTEIHGLLTYPIDYVKGTKAPFLLRIHGGPNGQDQHQFSVERQLFAAQGYAVLAVNYRGSAGRGQKFSRAIFADWGHYEVEDLLAGVEHVIKLGVADPDRLGVGGWSYGGILTDYLIATDARFKAATSGAGTAFTVSYYGVDQYITQYDYEIGPPWNAKAWETYQKLSYPFLHADRIKTPTLFLCGEKDFNVPSSGSEQMYQALRSLNIDTQLIIYPNENHGISRPSYVRDRAERYIAWYEKYLKKQNAASAAPVGAR